MTGPNRPYGSYPATTYVNKPPKPQKLTNARVDRTTTITLSGTKLTVLELHELLEEFNDEDVVSISIYIGNQLDSSHATLKVTKQK